MYDNWVAHDTTTLIPELTSSPWSNYTDLCGNDISMNATASNPSLSTVTNIKIDYTDNYNLNIKSWIQEINNGTSDIKAFLNIRHINQEHHGIYVFTDFKDEGSYADLSVKYLRDSSSNDVVLTENENYKIQFVQQMIEVVRVK